MPTLRAGTPLARRSAAARRWASAWSNRASALDFAGRPFSRLPITSSAAVSARFTLAGTVDAVALAFGPATVGAAALLVAVAAETAPPTPAPTMASASKPATVPRVLSVTLKSTRAHLLGVTFGEWLQQRPRT